VLSPKYDEDSVSYPIYDAYDNAGMLVPKYDEGWVFEKLSRDIDPPSQEPCVEDDKGEVDFGGESKSKNLLCDIPHHVDEIEQRPLALRDLEDQLLVTEEKLYKC
jgi:hypothetical protein